VAHQTTAAPTTAPAREAPTTTITTWSPRAVTLRRQCSHRHNSGSTSVMKRRRRSTRYYNHNIDHTKHNHLLPNMSPTAELPDHDTVLQRLLKVGRYCWV
jgi:hypothetical protein